MILLVLFLSAGIAACAALRCIRKPGHGEIPRVLVVALLTAAAGFGTFQLAGLAVGEARSHTQELRLRAITLIRTVQTDHGPHAVLGTDALDSQGNRLGFDFICKPEPLITFHLGFYPEGQPVTLMVGTEPFTRPELGGPDSGFFAPQLTGRKAQGLAGFALRPGRVVTNGAGTGFLLPLSLESEINQARKELPCLH